MYCRQNVAFRYPTEAGRCLLYTVRWEPFRIQPKEVQIPSRDSHLLGRSPSSDDHGSGGSAGLMLGRSTPHAPFIRRALGAHSTSKVLSRNSRSQHLSGDACTNLWGKTSRSKKSVNSIRRGVSTEGDWAILALRILGGVKVGSSWREQPSETARGTVEKVLSSPSHVTCALVHM